VNLQFFAKNSYTIGAKIPNLPLSPQPATLEKMKKTDWQIIRVKNDLNGNPRRVIHFLAFITHEDRENAFLLSLYDVALKKARRYGGKRFHNKQYGGGIVFQAYCDSEVVEIVNLATR